VGKPEGKRPLGRKRRRWVDNIKMDLREIGWDGLNWIDMAQDRDQWSALVNTELNLWDPWNAGKFLSGFTIGVSSRRAQLREWVRGCTIVSWPAARSEAWTVFARSNTGIVGSNPIRGVKVSMRLFCVYVALRVGSSLTTGWSPSRSHTDCV
jgi:hypothetical protein